MALVELFHNLVVTPLIFQRSLVHALLFRLNQLCEGLFVPLCGLAFVRIAESSLPGTFLPDALVRYVVNVGYMLLTADVLGYYVFDVTPVHYFRYVLVVQFLDPTITMRHWSSTARPLPSSLPVT